MERSSTSRRSGRTLQKYWPALLLLAVLLIAGSIGGVLLAKYITTNRQETAMVSAGFHMSSDLLETTAASNLGGVEDIVIELYNFEKENNAQISAVDITYTITVTHCSSCTINDGTNDLPVSGPYTLAGNGSTRVTHTITIVPDYTGDVSVTVAATEPFTKSLSGTFSYQAPQYKIELIEGDHYLMTIYTNGYNGNISITMGDGVYADRTVDLEESWSSSLQTLALHDNETYLLKFYGPVDPVSLTTVTNAAITIN